MIKDAALASSRVRGFCLVFKELAWSLGSRMLVWPLRYRMLPWPLMTWKASAKGVDWDMVKRTGGEVRAMLYKHGWDGGSHI